MLDNAAVSATMTAFRLVEWSSPPQLIEIPVPVPRADQVRVRVAGCGLCHSDLAMAQMPAEFGATMGWRVPFTLGHEAAGWIDAVGSGVDLPPGLTVGSAVVLVSPASCGNCRWCRRGQENACPHGQVGRGYGRDGGLAEFVVVDDPARSLVALGSLDPTIAGPLADAGATSHHAVSRIAPYLDAESTVVVIGAGGLGGFAVQLLRALTPARVVAVDPSPRRRQVALRYGAHHSVDGVDGDTGAKISSLVGSDPIDAVVDVVGSTDTITLAADLLAPGGALALVGAAGGTLRRPWFGALPRDGVVFSFQGSDRADLAGVVELAAAGRLVVDIDRFTLAEVHEAYRQMEAGDLTGRAVVTP